MFRFGIALGACDNDPASPARDAIARPRVVGYPGLTEPKEIGRLMAAIRGYDQGDPVVRAGLLLSAYLFPRPGEIRNMRWQDIDGETWIVPARFMQMKRDHIVPLPRQPRAPPQGSDRDDAVVCGLAGCAGGRGHHHSFARRQ